MGAGDVNACNNARGHFSNSVCIAPEECTAPKVFNAKKTACIIPTPDTGDTDTDADTDADDEDKCTPQKWDIALGRMSQDDCLPGYERVMSEKECGLISEELAGQPINGVGCYTMKTKGCIDNGATGEVSSIYFNTCEEKQNRPGVPRTETRSNHAPVCIKTSARAEAAKNGCDFEFSGAPMRATPLAALVATAAAMFAL